MVVKDINWKFWANQKFNVIGFPTKKSFIDMVIPQLNLNFENPEFNGIVKQNGIKSESVIWSIILF